ncbi:SCHIP-1 domain-containing protein [Aphelenchoides fujianensis]|nr:SCHIP-1 domain-containing protein [Aphelenchoides fujianensis]
MNGEPSAFKTEQIYRAREKLYRRRELSQLSISKLHALLEELMARVDVASNDLVGLLIKRDQKHMENDALRVEIDDLINFSPTSTVNIPPPILHTATKSKQRCK